jgi:transposase InsO family protein
MCEVITAELQAYACLSLRACCSALDVARADYYRFQAGVESLDADLELRDHIQRVALEWPSYGYRRITKELRRQGREVNHKRVLRLMREDNLLCLRKRSFIRTTDSSHSLRVYPNLAREMVVDGIDQLWVADLTYIRLLREFIYLAVILDAYSRRCVGWALGRSLEAGLAVEALKMALGHRQVEATVHHSDRGVQYASLEYTELLKENGIRISMSRRGNPYDNAKAESFMKTLKWEEVNLYEYESLEEARERIGHFLEEVYNRKRLHSALGYVPPVEFEQSLRQSTLPN